MSGDMKKSLEGVAKFGALMMVVILFFTSWKMISGITGNPPGKYTAMMTLLGGSYSINFWIGEVALGMVIPFVLIMSVRGRNMKTLFIASVAGMIGIFFMRYDLVVVGQLVPHYHGMGLVDYPELFHYMPSLHEVLITVGGFAFCGFLFLAGERLFRGHLSEDH
jgi:Ni/Fe-hydrogenase subunit HybB-like protein